MRKERTYTIESGRDAGKTFLIKEMSVIQADKWAQRALFAIGKSGVDASNLDLNGGMLEMAKFAFSAVGGIDPEFGGDLLDELLTCVQLVLSGCVPRTVLIEDDIEDVKTLYLLRKEVLAIHLDFLMQGNSQDLSN